MKKILIIPVMALLFCGCDMNNTMPSSAQMQTDVADTTITAKLKAEIMADGTLSATARMVSVTTNNGTVVISGVVPTQDDMDRIVAIAQGIDGVAAVDNQMTISNQ